MGKFVHSIAVRSVKSKLSFRDWCIQHGKEYLLLEWNDEKNNYGPDTVSYGSTKKIWWKCKLGHSWQATPNSRTNQHTGCPYCSGRRVLQGFNDLATKNPRIAHEWNFDKNGDLKPNQVTVFSNKSVWWKCPSGHEFKAPISARAGYNTGCPKCGAERKTSFPEKAVFFYVKKAFKDSEENVSFPWLGRMELDIYIPSIKVAIEYDGYIWHRSIVRDQKKDDLCEKNGIRLYRIREKRCPMYQSKSSKIFFEAEKGHPALEAAVKELITALKPDADLDINVDRDYATILENHITNVKANSLARSRPDIAADWDYDKNGRVTPEYVYVSSNRIVWWKCPKCGNRYRMMINSRTGSKHSGCPICAHKKIVSGVNDFATEYPELIKEWDFERNTILPNEISSGSKVKAFWKCSQGHSYAAVVYSRTSGKTGCPFCAHLKTDGANSFGALYPDLLNEWDFEQNMEDPYSLLPKSNKHFHWICRKCGFKFTQSLAHRTSMHRGCPLCAHQVLIQGINDLATQFPNVAAEWNYERNAVSPTQVSGGTNKKYWWRCKKCGFEWEAVVASRTKRGSGCPQCRRNKTKNR